MVSTKVAYQCMRDECSGLKPRNCPNRARRLNLGIFFPSCSLGSKTKVSRTSPNMSSQEFAVVTANLGEDFHGDRQPIVDWAGGCTTTLRAKQRMPRDVYCWRCQRANGATHVPSSYESSTRSSGWCAPPRVLVFYAHTRERLCLLFGFTVLRKCSAIKMPLSE